MAKTKSESAKYYAVQYKFSLQFKILNSEASCIELLKVLRISIHPHALMLRPEFLTHSHSPGISGGHKFLTSSFNTLNFGRCFMKLIHLQQFKNFKLKIFLKSKSSLLLNFAFPNNSIHKPRKKSHSL